MTTTTAALSPASIHQRPRWLSIAIVVGVILAVTMAASALTRSGAGNTDDLDPANPGRSGAQALANVLRARGIRVTVVRSQQALLEASLDATTTLAITHTDRLSGRTARAALAHAASAAGVVLLSPDTDVTEGMALPVRSHAATLENVPAGCTGADLGQGFRLARANRAYTVVASTAATTCFPDRSDGGAVLVSLAAADQRPPVTLLGDDSLVGNGAILNADNAAIALRLFGHSDRLVWYVPTAGDIFPSDDSSRSIAPAWFQPGIVLAASAVVLLCLWRGRRLGPLVTEPLPVVVRAVETTESRGRMYRRSRDRSRALTVLQGATRKRLTAYLGLSASTTVGSLAAAAAVVSGRNYQEVLDLLSRSGVEDDSALLTLAQSLSTLEKEVRRT